MYLAQTPRDVCQFRQFTGLSLMVKWIELVIFRLLATGFRKIRVVHKDYWKLTLKEISGPTPLITQFPSDDFYPGGDRPTVHYPHYFDYLPSVKWYRSNTPLKESNEASSQGVIHAVDRPRFMAVKSPAESPQMTHRKPSIAATQSEEDSNLDDSASIIWKNKNNYPKYNEKFKSSQDYMTLRNKARHLSQPTNLGKDSPTQDSNYSRSARSHVWSRRHGDRMERNKSAFFSSQMSVDNIRKTGNGYDSFSPDASSVESCPPHVEVGCRRSSNSDSSSAPSFEFRRLNKQLPIKKSPSHFDYVNEALHQSHGHSGSVSNDTSEQYDGTRKQKMIALSQRLQSIRKMAQEVQLRGDVPSQP
eukprot:GHVL01004166.1.p1 GENE.GHVL01004166.1~~GHVL01004166.1.p1  ORF type:complete len:360 (+),score=53.64 GHVL01004166.1:866-1945(+)